MTTFFGNGKVAVLVHFEHSKVCTIIAGLATEGSTLIIFMTSPHFRHGVVASLFTGVAMLHNRNETQQSQGSKRLRPILSRGPAPSEPAPGRVGIFNKRDSACSSSSLKLKCH